MKEKETKRQNMALQNSLTRAVFITFPFTCFDIFNPTVLLFTRAEELLWPFLGQSHHIFSRFANLQI